MNDVLVIIPTYNEKDNIKKLIDKLLKLYDNIDILVIDDLSPDNTYKIVNKYYKNYKRVNLIVNANKMGLGRAYIIGYKWAIEKGYKYIIQMDADFSHNPYDLEKFLSLISQEKSDLIIGSRYIKNDIDWNLFRLFLSKIGNLFFKFMVDLNISDVTSGYKAIKIEKLKRIDLDSIISKGFSFQIEINYLFYKKDYIIKEVPISFINRENGKSKMNLSIIIEAIYLVFFIKYKEIFNNE